MHTGVRLRWAPARLSRALAAAIIALCAFATSSARAASIEPLEIVTKAGVQVFSVELAATEEEKTTGLMYRKELPDGKGMLFDFSPAQEISMWMKNTYISLDMIFIRPDGRILRIAENTEPFSTKIIPSDRKSTRLNSSHRCISYAVFCLKKKNNRSRFACFEAM